MAAVSGIVRVVRIAVISRIIMVAMILLWRFFLHPYDTSAYINPPCLSGVPQRSNPPMWPHVGSVIEGSIVWDSVYFVRIAECGYEYEQTYAFFPILPVLISLMSRSVFAPLIPIVGYRAVLGLSGYVLNNIAFVLAAMYFYRLSVLVLKEPAAAMRASVLFCFNPASIFYSSVYTESLYALFSFGGLYNLFTGYNTIAVVFFALSGFARSNGVLNAGYFCFQTMHIVYKSIFQMNRPIFALQEIVVAVLRSVCIFSPFIAFQTYGYYNICTQPGIATDNLSPWCKARVPLLYDYLQSHYWGVGFLRYFQLKQLPNFLLASPILSLAVCSIVQYAKVRPDLLYSLGFQGSTKEKDNASLFITSGVAQKFDDNFDVYTSVSSKVVKGNMIQRLNRKEKQPSFGYSSLPQAKNHSQGKQGYFSFSILPFIYHLTFLTFTAFFVMHVQVASRFLSASPPIYWFASYVLSFYNKRSGYMIWAYFSAYILLGSLLFSNFYPFT
ncbi:GPI mannosyltransferase [Zostera marina]|uniref:GPI mannosyltransferase 2 n=1 Tax=Zostera marina TaxID=29655 RepID=A0A0K9PN14_ZOSMR|nr:GPI mannosyltransferase [Zostera marina]